MNRPTLAAVFLISLLLAVNVPSGMAQRPGGFIQIENHDEQALAAAKFAVTAHDPKLKFESIEKVERQVVAGTNYRMTLKVTDNGKERRADAVVWRKLDGQHALTSWKWRDAAPAKPAPI